MGYQALLFCPDEKLARVVSQVFTELDFTIEPVHEPFAAVKKLMTQRYDAIVVDCENEQNASLLFKSARNSSSNQSSLAIALVEGQAGVAKSYRIGANLVLTKPINVEQAKGTLRVARGLLRKNSDAAGASATIAAAPATPKTAPVSAGSSFQPASRSAVAIAPPTSPAEFPEVEAPEPTIPAVAASAQVEEEPVVVPAPVAQIQPAIAAEPAGEARQPAALGVIRNVLHNDIIKNDATHQDAAGKSAAVSVPAQNTRSAFTPAQGSAAAPAPAKDVTAPPAKEKVVASDSSTTSHDTPISMSGYVGNAPSFSAFGEQDKGSGVGKKVLIAAVVILALAALGYVGYGMFAKPGTVPAPHPVSTPQNAAQPAPTVAAAPVVAAPVVTPSTNQPDLASSATTASAPKTTAATPLDKPSAGAVSSPVTRIALDSEPATKKPNAAPILVKSDSARPKTKTPAQSEESAPQLSSSSADASANDSNLSGLMSVSPTLPKPSLATVKVSQGVSQGLVIKRVQPKYPAAALAVHAQGAVDIDATIDKEGNVTNVKVLKGDAILAHAAVEAVRQWRYKPYYLDGQPVEIETQITVNFKAN
jgi:periplasmic protein TonB